MLRHRLLMIFFGALLGLVSVGTAWSGEADEYWDKGDELYEEGFYDAALAKYSKAYELLNDPVLIFNMAQCYKNLNEHSSAIEQLDEFLRLAPDHELAERAETLKGSLARQSKQDIDPPCEMDAKKLCEKFVERETLVICLTAKEAELSKACVDHLGLGQTEAPEPPKKEEEAAPSSIGGLEWTLMLGGGALAIGGGVAIFLGELEHQEVVDNQETMIRSEAQDKTDAGDMKKYIGYALCGVGGAALVTGIVLAMTSEPAPAEEEYSAHFSFLPEGGLITFQGRF